MMRGRRGGDKPSSAGAAVLVVLIALLIILYVLFLPPDQRQALLGEGHSTPTPEPGPHPGDQVLFSTVPRIPQERLPDIRTLPSFLLRTVTSGNVLAERSGLVVEHSAFHATEERMSFFVPESAQNVYLSFTASEANGNLIIALDEEIIFDSRLSQRQPAPLHLAVGPGSHSLKFSASAVGFRIWEKHRFVLDDIRVTGDVTSFTQAAQTQRFVVHRLDEAQQVRLVFTPDCYESAGSLRVSLNGAPLYSQYPTCGMPISQDVALSRLVEGENELSWSVESGQYYIDDIAVIVDRKQDDFTEVFSITPEIYNRALSQGKNILLRLTFARPGAEGAVRLNGEVLRFRTHKQQFAAPISAYVRPGRNELTLVESTTDVVALEVLVG